MPRRLAPPQPPPCLLPAVPEGAVQRIQNPPNLPGYPTEYRHCKRERERERERERVNATLLGGEGGEKGESEKGRKTEEEKEICKI